MDMIALAPGFSVSRLTFGCGSLHHLGDASAPRLLDEAVELGFSHFDTAPSYGFGLGERRLAPLLRTHRDLTVTTKVGLAAMGPPASSWAGVLARKIAGRLFRPLARPVRLETVAAARASLDASLRRLGRERVDVLMMHEPDPDLLGSGEWRRWIEEEQAAGRVRQYGLAGTQARVRQCIAAGVSWRVQTEAHPAAGVQALQAAGATVDFLYSPISARAAGNSPTRALKAVAERFPECSLIVATRRIERLRELAGALS